MGMPLRLLIAEDSENDTLLVLRQLARGGYEIAHERVETAEAMAAALAKQEWDLVISDYNMPRFSGAAALKTLQDTGRDIPFILMSGAIGEEKAVELLKAGAHDFVSKMSPIRLLSAIEREVAQAKIRRERKRDEEQLRLLHSALTATANAIFITDRNGLIEWANAAFCRLSGHPAETLHGCTPRILKSGHQDASYYERMWHTILAGEVWSGDFVEQHKNGAHYVVHQTITPIRDAAGSITHFIGIHEDITQRKEIEARVKHMAYHDALTGLPNRILFQERLAHHITNAKRTNQRLAVHFLDLDQFKIVNDSLGHAVGDLLLKSVADRLQECVRATDTVARLGGDEFAILQPALASVDGAGVLAAKAIEAISRTHLLCGQEIHETASVGITLFPQDGTTGEQMLSNADMAMYLAKKEGRNQYRFYTASLNEEMQVRRTLEAELHQAIAQEQFVLHYQPEIDLRSGRMVGAEALIRWRHPTRGLLLPGDFIAFTEESGLIVPIFNLILRQLCVQNRAWQSDGLPAVRVALNVSVVNMKDAKLVDDVSVALAAAELDPQYVELELTESAILCDAVTALRTVNELHKIGVQFAIDDFGTGYSSLSYLKRLPFQKLKIDQSFIRDLPGNVDSAMIVKTIIELGHGLALKVIAEGVENEEQLTFLRENGCDEGQGYYFSRPVPAITFASLLEEEKNSSADTEPPVSESLPVDFSVSRNQVGSLEADESIVDSWR